MAFPAHRPLSAEPAASNVISLHALKTRCSNCSMRELCLPIGLDHDALRQLDDVVTKRVRLKKGDVKFASDGGVLIYNDYRVDKKGTDMVFELSVAIVVHKHSKE